jgi:hypothetical protein
MRLDGGANIFGAVTAGCGDGDDVGSVEGWRAGQKSFAPAVVRRALSGSAYARSAPLTPRAFPVGLGAYRCRRKPGHQRPGAGALGRCGGADNSGREGTVLSRDAKFRDRFGLDRDPMRRYHAWFATERLRYRKTSGLGGSRSRSVVPRWLSATSRLPRDVMVRTSLATRSSRVRMRTWANASGLGRVGYA